MPFQSYCARFGLGVVNNIRTYDTLTLANSGSTDIFICKYTNAGRLVWATRLSGTGNDVGNSISMDSSGNVYVTGTYDSTPITIFNSDGSTFGTLSNAVGTDAFVIKYNTNGIAQWVTRVGGTANEFGNGIFVGLSGNVYVIGSYSTNPVTIYNANGTTFGTLSNSGGPYDVFVVK